jgi:nucleotide-binding universal stress UspA family protein
MKKVLIALDYDKTARKVAEQGYALAKSMLAEVILMHVVNNPTYYASTEYSPVLGFDNYLGTSPLQLENMEGLIEASQYFLDKTILHLDDLSIRSLVKKGEIADEILKTANDLDVDLIVLGTHSRKWLENIILGSVASDVLKRSLLPLFIIPTRKRSE